MAGWLWSVVGEENYFWDMATRTRRHWVIVASREHARRHVTGGFVMANHGKRAPLTRNFPRRWHLYLLAGHHLSRR